MSTFKWDVFAKGDPAPYHVHGVAPEVNPDEGTVTFKSGKGDPLAVFPINAVAGIVRVKVKDGKRLGDDGE